MNDRSDVVMLIPHYLVLVVLVLMIMQAVRTAVGTQHLLVEFALILALVFSYRPLVVRIDAIPTPGPWQNADRE